MSIATVSPSSPVLQTMDLTCVNTIRTLSMDAVQAANSGHPGTPMALAPVAYCLWQQFLRFDPQDPVWPNRDRFVLSIGHASMLLYSLLHLTEVRAVSKDYETLGEVSVPLDAIKAFRQLDSRCPGHPEYRWTSGVETTTGPLGQGVATSVGIAIARQWLAARYNRARLRGSFRLQRLRALRRWMHDGRHLKRSCLSCWTPTTFESLLDLRQQPHHDRRQYFPGVYGRRGHAFYRLRLERDSGWRCKRPRHVGPCFPHLS